MCMQPPTCWSHTPQSEGTGKSMAAPMTKLCTALGKRCTVFSLISFDSHCFPDESGPFRYEREPHGDLRFLDEIIRKYLEPRPPCLVLGHIWPWTFPSGRNRGPPKPPFKFDPSDPTKLAEFRNRIWCVIALSLLEKALIFLGRLL